jgi:hypothetical protein
MQIRTAMVTPIQTLAQRRPPALPAEERCHDAHDEDGFQAFSEPDDEGR